MTTSPVTTAIPLYKHLDPFFQTDYAAQRIPSAFGRAYVAVPDRRPETLRFLKITSEPTEIGEKTGHRIPCGIPPPTTYPTVDTNWAWDWWATVTLVVEGVFDANAVFKVKFTATQAWTGGANVHQLS